MDKINLLIEGKIKYLHTVTTLSREVCSTIKSQSITTEFINAVELIVSEACTNAILHTENSDSQNKVCLQFKIFDNKLVIEVKDQGKGFDFDNLVSPDFENPTSGGYGLYIIKSNVNEVKYFKENSWNILSMTKLY